MSRLELFCSVDDFWQQFAPHWHQDLLSSGQRQRVRPTQLHPSEMMTIMILFHQSHSRTFKAYDTEYVQRHLHSEFPTLVSYQRFVEVMPTILSHWSPTYTRNWVAAPASVASTPLPLLSVTTPASTNTASLPDEPLVAKPRLAGFTASSCTWWSMTRASWSPFVSPQAMSMIGILFPSWPQASSASSKAPKAISPSHSPSSCWSPKGCTSSPNCAKRCTTVCSTGRTHSSDGSEPSLRPSLISSKTSRRSSIRAIVVPSTSS